MEIVECVQGPNGKGPPCHMGLLGHPLASPVPLLDQHYPAPVTERSLSVLPNCIHVLYLKRLTQPRNWMFNCICVNLVCHMLLATILWTWHRLNSNFCLFVVSWPSGPSSSLKSCVSDFAKTGIFLFFLSFLLFSSDLPLGFAPPVCFPPERAEDSFLIPNRSAQRLH